MADDMDDNDVLDNVVDVAEAADQLDVSEREVRELLLDGSLKGKKIGTAWAIDARSINDVAEELDAGVDLTDDDDVDDEDDADE
jgi:hypothetical protein